MSRLQSRSSAVVALAASVVLVLGLAWVLRPARAADPAGAKPMLAHNVFFTLADDTPANRQKLVEACHKHLSGHDGVVFYAAGTVNAELDREVNDLDFDVGLHLIFRDRAAHDVYQTHPRHLEFIASSKALWSKVRVFDSDVSGK